MAKKKPKEAQSTLSQAKSAVVHAAEKVADVAVHAAESAKVHVVTPVAEAVGIVKKKKPRFVREKKAAKPKPAPTPTAPTKKTTKGKMMSKPVTATPKKKPTGGGKSKGEI